MQQQTADGFLNQYQPSADAYLDQYAKDNPTVTEDIGKSIAANAARSVPQTADFLGDTINGMINGVTRLTGAAKEGLADLGIGQHLTLEQAQQLTNPATPFYGSQDITNAVQPSIQKATGANINYQAKTEPGKLAGAAVNFLPMAVNPEVSVPKAMAAGLGSELGKEAGAEIGGEGSKAEQIGSLAGGIAGSVVPDMASSAYKSLIPKVQNSDEINAANKNLQGIKNSTYNYAESVGGVLTPTVSDHVGISVPADVQAKTKISLDANATPQTKSVINSLVNESKSGLNTNSLEVYRQQLNNIISKPSTLGLDRTAAIEARNSLDRISTQIENNPNMLIGGDIRAMQAFRDSRYNNSIYQRHSDIADIVNDARSNPAKIQSGFQKLLQSKNENDYARYDPDEQAIIEKVAYPNGVDTKVSGTGLGEQVKHAAGIMGKATAGAIAGGEAGHPVIGGTLGAIKGTYDVLGDTLAKAKILKGADDLLNLIASKAKPISPRIPASMQGRTIAPNAIPNPNSFRAKLGLGSGRP